MPALPESDGTAGVAAAAGSGLARLQLGFIRAVLHRDDAGLGAWIGDDAAAGGSLDAARRIGVYRSNARENFADALAAAFPLLAACVGPREFRQLAWAYQRESPSRAGNLFHIGRALKAFLDAHVRGTPDEYLVDVATLEWAIQESLVAADADEAMDTGWLAAIPEERQGSLRVELHPAVRLLASRHAIFHLWESQQATLRLLVETGVAPPENPPPAVPPPCRPEHLLVQRQADGVRLHRLAALDFRWLCAMEQGSSLADSTALLDESAAAAGSAALAGLLGHWMQQGVITGFRLPEAAA